MTRSLVKSIGGTRYKQLIMASPVTAGGASTWTTLPELATTVTVGATYKITAHIRWQTAGGSVSPACFNTQNNSSTPPFSVVTDTQLFSVANGNFSANIFTFTANSAIFTALYPYIRWQVFFSTSGSSVLNESRMVIEELSGYSALP